MKTGDIIAALDLPASSIVNQRIAKKLLVENGAATSADKRHINDGVAELIWVAALKPHSIGVPAYRDQVREYLEIAVLTLDLRPDAKNVRIMELVHRAIPYPVMLVSARENSPTISAAHKRHSQTEEGKVVLDSEVVEAEIPEGEEAGQLRQLLGLPAQPRVSLLALYQGWVECLEAMQAAKITGEVKRAQDAETAAVRRAAIAEYERLVSQIAALRSQAAKESQISRRVELNLELKCLEAALAAAKKQL